MKDLEDLVDSMKTAAVLIVGDIMLDRYVYGAATRLSPESPVPVLSIRREDAMLGGAGNALANLAGLGARAKILSVVGEDDNGDLIKEKTENMGLDTSGLLPDPARPTIVKTRFLAGHQQLLRTDFESNAPVSDAVAKDILARAKDMIGGADALILSDYGKGLLRRDVIAGLIKLARKAGIPAVVDPKGQDFSIYRGATAITPNKKELSGATKGMEVDTDADIEAAAGRVIRECGIEAVVATRSSDGMSIVQKRGEPVHLPTANIEVFDVSGAGDTVIATIAAALAACGSLEQAGMLANAAGGIVVTKVGTAPIRAAELKEALSSRQSDSERLRKAEILDWPAAVEQVRRWQARGLKVGFTNGCFDVLHFGHVSYLNEARRNCDRLIVGLNGDASVRILKGAGRPVHNEDSRAGVLAGLGAVDMVVIFGAAREGEDNTASGLLNLLRPDIYFKGGDYTEDEIPETPAVRAYGGEVSVMPVYEGHSTTSSIRKIKNEAA